MLAPVFDRVCAAGDPTRRASDVSNLNADFIGPLLAGATVREALASAAWGDLITATQQSQLRDWSRRFAAASNDEDDATVVGPSGTVLSSRELTVLSSREHEVLQRIAAGDSNKLIARAFELSPHTVKRHVANILDKLALQSRGQAAAWFRDHG
jgi:LuxR family transcriptional regulator, maltose regulon positive regulatory protein